MINNSNWEQLQVQLRSQIINSLLKNRFLNPMPVQQAAIPLLLQNYDVAVEAQTGSGKTLSFLIPLLQKYLSVDIQNHRRNITYVIISPTRQLCQQTFNVLQKIISSLPDKQRSQNYLKYVKNVTGGNELKQDLQKVKNQTIVLIGTVGRLKELSNNFQQNWLKKVQQLYIDQADRILKQKGIKQLLKLFQKVRRTSMFSATLQSLKKQDFQFYGMRNPVKVSIKSLQKKQKKQDKKKQNQTQKNLAYVIPKNLNNIYILMQNRLQKINFLIQFLTKQLGRAKTIVFFNTCSSVDFYTKLFKQLFTQSDQQAKGLIEGIHGKLKNKKRNKMLKKFTQLRNGCLFATDVVSRGIDFDHIHYIIQVDPPQDPDNYIHRIGRTARINKPGTAILLIQKHEQTFIKYLQNKQVGVKQQKIDRFIKQQRDYSNKLMEIVLTDRDYIEKSKKAFVSFIRSYKEHDLKYIFQFKNLDIGYTARSFYLLRIPRIKQILGKKIQNFQQSEINIQQISWKDHNQEMQYQLKKQRIEQLNQQKYKYKQIIDIKNNKSKRKRLKAKRQQKQIKQISKEYSLLKKERKNQNQIQDQYDFLNQEDSQQIQRKMVQKYGH